MHKGILAGVDIGGTKIAVVLGRELPETLVRVAFPSLPERGPELAVNCIIEHLNAALLSQGFTAADLSAIGVSCGSPLDPISGLITSPPNLPTWKNVRICEILEDAFAVPCFLENDANAGALAEFSFGTGRGTNDFIFLTMGTGLGAGLILNGALYRGASNAAGEIGHVRLTRSGPRGHGRVGTVEGWASGGGMAQVAAIYLKAALARGNGTILSSLSTESSSTLTALDVAKASREGDRVAQAVVKKIGERLGETIAILIDIINPECIAVGGLALRFGEDLLGPARDTACREALRGSAEGCRIMAAALGEQIGDVAALCIAARGLASKKVARSHDDPLIQAAASELVPGHARDKHFNSRTSREESVE